jgi:hypothetical protein
LGAWRRTVTVLYVESSAVLESLLGTDLGARTIDAAHLATVASR